MRSDETAPPVLFEALWNANDVARYLKASRSWVYQKAETGLLPCLRIEGLLRFEPEEIRAFARGEAGSAQVISIDARGRRRCGGST